MNPISTSALALVVALATAPAGAAALFSEDFEGYGVTPGNFLVRTGVDMTPRWSIYDPFGGAGSVDVVSSTFNGSFPALGGASLDLNGTAGPGFSSQGAIATTLTGMTPGQEYILEFQYSGNFNNEPANKRFAVGFQNASLTFSNGIGPGQNEFETSQPAFQAGTMRFTATANTVDVRFNTLLQNTQGGAVLDNIAVAAVPEAHEWAMMLAGLGLVGWVARRRSRTGGDAAFA